MDSESDCLLCPRRCPSDLKHPTTPPTFIKQPNRILDRPSEAKFFPFRSSQDNVNTISPYSTVFSTHSPPRYGRCKAALPRGGCPNCFPNGLSRTR
jgi:hypothetical protein